LVSLKKIKINTKEDEKKKMEKKIVTQGSTNLKHWQD
jgi:hypothetical protein